MSASLGPIWICLPDLDLPFVATESDVSKPRAIGLEKNCLVQLGIQLRCELEQTVQDIPNMLVAVTVDLICRIRTPWL